MLLTYNKTFETFALLHLFVNKPCNMKRDIVQYSCIILVDRENKWVGGSGLKMCVPIKG